MKGERAATTVAMTAVVALLGLLSVATASLGATYAAKGTAETAADAAALAAAVATYPGTGRSTPVAEAASTARANGARLVSCTCPMDRTLDRRVVAVLTEVAVDLPVLGQVDVVAAARAEFDPRRWLGR